MLDKEITKGAYWGGSQIDYWVYLIAVWFGFLGADHLLLRSPLTAILKVLSIIPLFGFWYFYDIAQAYGEADLVKKYGIAVPFYGPIGVGTGMFHEPGVRPAPADSPRPWRYMAYAIVTCMLVAFPVNKLVIGDYAGFMAQCLMYIMFPLTFMAIFWGFYDIYRVLFDTRGVLDKGAARVFPADMFLDPYFDPHVLGPKAGVAGSSIFGAIPHLINAAIDATAGVVTASGEAAKGVVASSAEAAMAVPRAVATSAEAAAKGAEAMSEAATQIATLPSKLDPSAITAKMVQQGGGSISSSSAVVFSALGVIVFSGYVFYAMKKISGKVIEKSDDPPRDAGAVREYAKDDRP